MKLSLFLITTCLWGQAPLATTPAAQTPPSAPSDAPDEMKELGRLLSEGGNSPADYTRVLEAHLAKHPNTTHAAEIYRALAKAALESRDDVRIIKYGELGLAADPKDVQLLDRVSRAYVMRDDAADAEKGLTWAKKYEQTIVGMRKEPPPGRLSAGQWSDELDKAQARSLVLQARACGILGLKQPSIDLAEKSFQAYPTAEASREWSKALAANGDLAGAVQHQADAFTIEDSRNTDEDRAQERRRIGELYTKLNGSEKGLGEVILASYDRMSNLMTDRVEHMKTIDPNIKATALLDFTLPGANGKSLQLSTLKGKTLVLDFWATWCGPCKAQRPIYVEVEKKFKDNPDVVFLSVNTDEDRKLVVPFVTAQKWTNPVYFEGGLADYLKVSSLPTTVIVDKTGHVSSRMNGFIPELFEAQLTERVKDTLR
jgi:thiol-disulfide isomerase/thioredoxin